MTVVPTITLNNGVTIPQLGYVQSITEPNRNERTGPDPDTFDYVSNAAAA
ncbi:MAG: hypothetical protein QOI70_1187 [Microbacteriaceae bacterium]|jgi:hypothetical protein|nr:hypothetical protein [Microbacteriaceae bacterium]